MLVHPANATPTQSTSKALKEAARALGLDVLFFNASTPAEIDAAFAAFGRERAEALFIEGDGFFYSRGVQLATLAVRDRLPAKNASREMVEAGLLMSYGANLAEHVSPSGHLYRQYSQGHQSSRPPSFATNQVRVGH